MKSYLNKFICGDALEVLKTFPGECVDIIITSPPYNLGDTHHTGNKRHNPYPDNLPETKYQEMQIAVLEELYRVIKTNGSVFYNHKNRIKNGISITPYVWILRSPFIVKQELVWFNRSPNFDKVRFYPFTERIYWLSKSPKTEFINTINHHDVFNWKTAGTTGQHTRAFPREMVADILACFPQGWVVLDPYMGSGTTALVALLLGRKFIGIDISEKYCKMAQKRIEEEIPLLAGKMKI